MQKVTIIAPLLAIDGYGYSAQNLALGLKNQGFEVNFKAQDWKIDKFSKPELLAILKEKINLSDPAIIYHLPPTLGQYQDVKGPKMAFTMFETTRLPQYWVNCLNRLCDCVLVPSQFCKDVFIKSGVKKHIEVIQLGINLADYQYMDRPDNREIFTFLAVANMDERKNIKAALSAFYEEFGSNEPVRFIVKTRQGSPVTFLPKKNIEIIEEDYTTEQMQKLYFEADAFVYPSRGEGFGLPPREAMATGLPTILTNWSALEDISNPMYSYPIEKFDLVPAKYPKSELLGIDPILGKWAAPDKDEIAKLMRHIFLNRKEAKVKGWLAANIMKTKANPDVGAGKLKQVIKQLKYGKKTR